MDDNRMIICKCKFSMNSSNMDLESNFCLWMIIGAFIDQFLASHNQNFELKIIF